MGDNSEYKFLRDEALRRAKQGRGAIIDAERKFYNAFRMINEHVYAMQRHRVDEIMEALGDYPAVLRSVMDAEDEARYMLSMAEHVRRMERLNAEADAKLTPPTEK